MTLLLKTEDLVAERRAVRVSDIAAATHTALQHLERLLAASRTPIPADTSDIRQRLLFASDAPAPASGGGAAAAAAQPAVSRSAAAATAAASASMLGPGVAVPFRLGISSTETTFAVEGRVISCDKAAEVLGAAPLPACMHVCMHDSPAAFMRKLTPPNSGTTHKENWRSGYR